MARCLFLVSELFDFATLFQVCELCGLGLARRARIGPETPFEISIYQQARTGSDLNILQQAGRQGSNIRRFFIRPSPARAL